MNGAPGLTVLQTPAKRHEALSLDVTALQAAIFCEYLRYAQ